MTFIFSQVPCEYNSCYSLQQSCKSLACNKEQIKGGKWVCKYVSWDSRPHMGTKVELGEVPTAGASERWIPDSKASPTDLGEGVLKVEAIIKLLLPRHPSDDCWKPQFSVSPGLQPLHPSSQEQRSPLVSEQMICLSLTLAEDSCWAQWTEERTSPEVNNKPHLSLDHYHCFHLPRPVSGPVNTHTHAGNSC